MMTKRGVIRSGASAASLLLGVSIANAAVGVVSGTLQVGEERFSLNQIFAVMQPDMLSAGQKEKITVLLTDNPLPDELRKASTGWFYWADRHARAGELHGLILNIDPETGVWDSGQLLTRSGLMIYSESVSSPELSRLRFAPEGKLGDHVAGKVSMKESMATMMEGDVRWTVAANIHCDVIPPPTVSAVLTGKAALESPEYKAVLAFLDVCQKKDLDSIRKSVDLPSWESLAAMLATNKPATLKMVADNAAGTAKLKIDKITVRGDSAELQFVNPKGGSDDNQSLSVTLVNGEWKMSQ